MKDRRRKIVSLLSANGKMAVNGLAESLGVSTVTVRQDLTALEGEGLVRRVHGGAELAYTDNLSGRLTVNYEKKLCVAQAAADLVRDGDTILIESGSANALLAREVAKKRRVTVVTPNAFIARQVWDGDNRDQGNVILLGGLYQWESESMVGSLARMCLEHIRFSVAFIGIDGISATDGVTNHDMMRAELSALIVRCSPRTVIACDSSKIGHADLVKFANPSDIALLITNGDASENEILSLRQTGLSVDLV